MGLVNEQSATVAAQGRSEIPYGQVMEFFMHNIAKLLCASGLALATNSSVCALDVHHVHGFTLRKGEAVRVTPEGLIKIVQLQRGTPQDAEMKRAAQLTAGGLSVWLGDDGKPRFLADAVEAVGMGGHILPWEDLRGARPKTEQNTPVALKNREAISQLARGGEN
jgi:hypothetical protein